MINIDVIHRPSIKDLLNMEPIRKRLEGSDLILNNFNDYSIIRGLQTNIYPPMNIDGWYRVVKNLREILNMDKEELFKKESEYNYNAVLKYLPPPSINEKNEFEKKYLIRDVKKYDKLPSLRNESQRNEYISKYSNIRPRVRVDSISKKPTRLSSPPWAKHFY